ncbi:AAA family ATPase [Rhodococcus tibetensis]|uniref:AAA family ATPase n=1 Tax=Rhodococcus tibetensis TaxID=2965064 RepID=A0ABT1QKY7_9NOCA|nr:LuxR family transcriptional regulator [Rhodococcus sp. FXJ9.536]MCQ4122323.1 AAA family ATPase [Rhodococcus sp. FXJ9.536]
MSQEIYGRSEELGRLRALLHGAAGGTGQALVVTGDPGIGKSALVGAVVVEAAGFTVLRCAAAQSESQLAFAALHELLWPVLDRIEGLPPPQRRALSGALGLTDDAADRFLVSVAVLTLLSDLSSVETPVLVVADDAQWLDSSTAECLAFVSRRVRWDAVALLAVASSHSETALGEIPTLPVGPLSNDDAARLLSARRSELDRSSRDYVIAVSQGNPLALLTLSPPVGALDPTAPAPVSARIRDAFRSRVGAMSAQVRGQLLVAAAQDGATLSSVQSVSRRLGLGDWALDDTTQPGVVGVLDNRVLFRHRLVQSVVYDAATPLERTQVHLSWSEELAHDGDEDRRAWHLAAASDGPDDDVANLLEASANRAWQRGGPQAAAAALRSAAELTRDRSAAGMRLARAARAEWEAGRVAAARDLLSSSVARIGSRAGLVSGGLEGLIEFTRGDCVRAHKLLLRDARLDPEGPLGLELAVLAMRAGWAASQVDLESDDTIETALGHPVLADMVGRLLAWWRRGEGVEAFAPEGEVKAWLLPPAPYAAVWGLSADMQHQYRSVAERSRAEGSTSALAFTLSQLATAEILGGRWQEAAAAATEALEIAEVTQLDSVIAQCHNSLAWLAALRGDVETTEKLASVSARIAQRTSVRALVAAAQWHRGVAHLVTGVPAESLALLAPIRHVGTSTHHPTFALLAAPDAAEAAIRVGDRDEARAQIDLLEQWAARSGAPWARSAHLRSMAMLSDGAEAERLFREALAVHDSVDRPLHHARTELLFGEWLRRMRRRQEARPYLARASEMFGRLGSTPLLLRAKESLDLATQAPRGRELVAFNELTAQELRVSRLAALGSTNRQIAAQLFISPRTVGHHLSAVFAKLGITSRAELRGRDLGG